MPTVDNMKTATRACPGCGQPRPALEFAPHDWSPDWAGADFSNLGALTPLMKGMGRGFCRPCWQRQEIGRVMPSGFGAIVAPTSPLEDEVKRLRALLEKPAPPPDPTPDGSQFRVDEVIVTPTAALLVGRGLEASYNVLRHGGHGSTEYHRKGDATQRHLGREAILEFVTRFCRGDLGVNGSVRDGDPSAARAFPPKASYADQAALAIASSEGTIFGEFSVVSTYPPGHSPAVESLRLWAELSPGRPTAILASVGQDGVHLDG